MKRLALFTVFLLLVVAPTRHSAAVSIDITLIDLLDQFGSQIEVLQAIEVGGVLKYQGGIYDTGASVVAVSKGDQTLASIPVKCAGCAGADAIGGGLNGDVGVPATVYSDGLNNADFIFDFDTLDFSIKFFDKDAAAQAPGIQTFIGTSLSESLPSITGTPIHVSGKAARVDMDGYGLDLGDLFGTGFGGLVITQPNVSFVDPSTTLPAGAGFVTDAFRVPLDLLGGNNSANPGDDVTSVDNPVQTSVSFTQGVNVASDKTMLFDTGAQLTIFSTDIAQNELGLDLGAPDFTIAVQGAAGQATNVPGFVVDQLTIPVDDDGDGTFDGEIRLHDVPIFVLDVIPELDGILGMNLFNTAEEFIYNPFDPNGPSLNVSFNTDPDRGLGGLEQLIEELFGLGTTEGDDLAVLLGDPIFTDLFEQSGEEFGLFAGVLPVTVPNLPNFLLQNSSSNSAAVPEPGSLLLVLVGMLSLLSSYKRRRGLQTV